MLYSLVLKACSRRAFFSSVVAQRPLLLIWAVLSRICAATGSGCYYSHHRQPPQCSTTLCQDGKHEVKGISASYPRFCSSGRCLPPSAWLQLRLPAAAPPSWTRGPLPAWTASIAAGFAPPPRHPLSGWRTHPRSPYHLKTFRNC